MKLEGWTNFETAALATWIAVSPFADLIRDLGQVCGEQAAAEGASTEEVITAFSSLLATRLPANLQRRTDSLLDDTSPMDPESFVLPLAVASMRRVDWKQLAQHWAENCFWTLDDSDTDHLGESAPGL